MSTSNRNEKAGLQRILTGLIVCAGCAIFGGIYEHFGHGVYSGYMIYAFLLPLILSVIPGVFLRMRDAEMIPEASGRLWNFGVATLTVGCILKGALEIYGTTNHRLIVYPVLAGIFAAASVIVWIAKNAGLRGSQKTSKRRNNGLKQ